LFVPYFLNAQTAPPYVSYLDSITENEDGNKLSFPSFVFAEPVKGEIYVIDGKSGIIIYTSDLFPLFTLSKRNDVESALGLAVDDKGNMYVAQSATKDNPKPRISVFNGRLQWERDIYLEGFEGAESFTPYRLAVDKNGSLYVTGSYVPRVLILNNKGKLLGFVVPEESGREVNVNYVTIDRSGRLFIVSEEEGRIYVYDENRNFLFKFGQKGGSTGKLSRPQAVGVDSRSGRMYVVDYMRHTISAYDKEGKYLFEFGGLGWGEGWFQYPRDITVDSTGRIFIADTFNNRIEVFQPKE
jgi:DNA-binding beta-propeller fold protein YncE